MAFLRALVFEKRQNVLCNFLYFLRKEEREGEEREGEEREGEEREGGGEGGGRRGRKEREGGGEGIKEGDEGRVKC